MNLFGFDPLADDERQLLVESLLKMAEDDKAVPAQTTGQ
jgi:hypothetical protein